MNKVTKIIRGILKGSVVKWWCCCCCGGMALWIFFQPPYANFLKGGLL